jgi:hypothetical protein
MEPLLKLVQENKIVKLVTPRGDNAAISFLLLQLKKLGYLITILVSNEKKLTLDTSNEQEFISLVTVKEYLTNKSQNYTKNTPKILIIDNSLMIEPVDSILIISKWKSQILQKYNSKLLINTLSMHSYFPSAPSYIVKIPSSISIRYIRDYSLSELVVEMANLVYKIHNSTIKGNFLVLILSQYKTQLETLFSNMDFNFLENKRKIFVTDDLENLQEMDFSCIFDCMRKERNIFTLTGGIRKEIDYITLELANIRAFNSNHSSVIVYRMISEETFNDLIQKENRFDHTNPFEIPLHHLMIDMYEKNLNPFEILPSLYPSNNLQEDMKFIYSLFLSYGILDISMRLTSKAKLLRKLPFGLRPALLCIESGSAILPSLIDNYISSPFLVFSNVYEKHTFGNPYFSPSNLMEKNKDFQKQNKREEYNVADYEIDAEVHIRRYYNRFRGESDCETFLNLYNDSLNVELKQWSFDNAISYSYMKNVYQSIEIVNKILENNRKDENVLTMDFIITKLYADRKMHIDNSRQIFTQYIRKDVPYAIDSMSINLIEEKRPLEIYALISSKVSDFSTVSFSYVSTNLFK